MLRSSLALLFALSLIPALRAQGPDVPWVVWRETTAVRSSADREAAQLATLAHGDEVSGEMVTNPVTDEEWLCFEVSGETRCVTMNDLLRIHPGNRTGGDLPLGAEIANRWWALPPTYEPSDLAALPRHWLTDEDRELRLRRGAMEALIEMLTAGERDGVEIRVASAYRSFEQQERNYRGAIRRLGPGQRQVARPGHSEHQLGTTVDLDDTSGRHSLTEAFGDTPEGRWLAENAASFGWRQSYSRANSPETGYDPEPWHFRFFGRPEPLPDTVAASGSSEEAR